MQAINTDNETVSIKKCEKFVLYEMNSNALVTAIHSAAYGV